MGVSEMTDVACSTTINSADRALRKSLLHLLLGPKNKEKCV